MVESSINHVSILAHDLEETAQFYEEVFGMERIPSPNFPVDVEWLRCSNDLTLHLFKRDDIEISKNYHFGIHVDDFEEVYQTVKERGLLADFGDNEANLYELPDGAVQMYINDPEGNDVEVNYHDVDDLDRSIVSEEILKRSDQRPQTGEHARARLYFDSFLESIGVQPRSAEAD